MSPISTPRNINLRKWLHALPCIMDGRVTIDVRARWPIALIGFKACVIQNQMDFIWFITNNLD